MNTGDFPNANVFSVPNNSTVLPANGDGVFQEFGVEFYVQCLALGPSTTPSQGWPALWSWSFENGSTIGQGNGPPITFGSSSGLTPTEIDFFETYGNIYGVYPDLDYGMGIHYPAGESGVYSGNFPNAWDNNWHAVGCLVTSTHVTAYLDNAAVGGSPCVISSACPNLSSCHQFLILGTGNNWRVNLDYARVWMA